MTRITLLSVILCLMLSHISAKFDDKLAQMKGKQFQRNTIVFDKMTPNVFYCPTEKPSATNKLIVRARPLQKLCEYEGRPLPDDHKPDCYENIDESNYACKEKYRIMKRITRAMT